MSGIKAPKVRTDFTFATKCGQIGPQFLPNQLQALQARLQGFLSSPTGLNFIKNSIETLTGQRWNNFKSVRAEIFQQGYFQFILKVQVQQKGNNDVSFCMVLSKGGPNDNVTMQDFTKLSYYHTRYPDHFVRPLFLHSSGGLVLYSSELYPKHLELNYKIDGVQGRNGLHINSAQVGGVRPFKPEEQDRLLEEMVMIQAMAYDEKSGIGLEGIMVNSGDYIVNFESINDFSLRLITVRYESESRTVPEFICRILNYITGLYNDPRMPNRATHVGRLFGEATIYNGLVRAFQHKEKLSANEAQMKAFNWMRDYHQALERGELDDLIRAVENETVRVGLGGLPVYHHPRSDASSTT